MWPGGKHCIHKTRTGCRIERTFMIQTSKRNKTKKINSCELTLGELKEKNSISGRQRCEKISRAKSKLEEIKMGGRRGIRGLIVMDPQPKNQSFRKQEQRKRNGGINQWTYSNWIGRCEFPDWKCLRSMQHNSYKQTHVKAHHELSETWRQWTILWASRGENRTHVVGRILTARCPYPLWTSVLWIWWISPLSVLKLPC